MAVLYAAGNVPLPVVGRLRELGHDVLAMVEDGKCNRRYPDALVRRNRPVVSVRWASFCRFRTRLQSLRSGRSEMRFSGRRVASLCRSCRPQQTNRDRPILSPAP